MKRIIVLMLACLMLLSVVPFAVFAEDVHEAETEATTEQVVCPDAKTVTNKTHTVTAAGTKAPQCGERGYTVYTCSCGKMFLDSYVEAAEGDSHKYELVKEGTAATCATAGMTDKYVCSVCEKVKPGSGETIEKTEEHKYIKDGESIVCEFCGKAQEDISECSKVESGEHNWDYAKYTTLVAPTCDKEGSATISCANKCGATKTIIIEATEDHDLGDKIKAEDPTCTEAGWYAHYVCKNCGRYFDEDGDGYVTGENNEVELYNPTIEKLGHSYNCIDKNATVKCIECEKDVLATEATPVHPEEFHTLDPKAADCTTYGFTVETCQACGLNEITDYVEPLGHEWSKTGTLSERNECGLVTKTYTCTRNDCTATDVVAVNEAVHTWENVVITEATCTVKEVTGNKCKKCGFEDKTTFVTGEKDSKNHSNATATVIIAATCVKTGSSLVECEACGVKEVVVVAANGHEIEYYNGDTKLDINCNTVLDSTNKKATAKCANCTEYVVENVNVVVPAHKKAETDNGEAHKATCSNAAYVTYTCTECQETYDVYSGEKLPYDAEKDVYTSVAEALKVHTKLNLAAVSEGRDCSVLGKVYYTCEGCELAVVVVGAGTPHTYPEEYACGWEGELKCEVCDAVLPVKATEHKWVLDTVSVDANGNKLTYAPICEVVGHNYYVCTNAYCGEAKTEDVTALAHEWKVIVAAKEASCLINGIAEERECKLCGALDEVETPDSKTNHKLVATEVKPTCEKSGFTVQDCEYCTYEYAEEFTAPTGHVNKDGKNPVNACDDEVEDRTCVNTLCDYTDKVVPTHAIKKTEVEGTCTTQGYTIEVCTKCDGFKNIVLDEEFGVHEYAIDEFAEDGLTEKEIKDIIAAVKAADADALAEAHIVYTPVLYKDGKIEFACFGCDVIDETKTIVISAEDQLGDNYGKTIGMTLAVDNANKAGAGFSDSSIVAVTVNLNTLNEVGVWGMNFDFTYKTDKLVYVGYEFAEDSVFTGYANVADNLTWDNGTVVESIADVVLKANDYITYDEVKELYTVYRASATSVIKVGTNVANDENGKIVNAAVMGEELAVVTLYFEIVDKFNATQNADKTFDVTDEIVGAFQITDVTAYNKDVEEVNAIADKASDITVNQFLNINNDGAVNFADVLAVWKMISGETEADYNVVADVDKNGVIEAADFMAIYSYILGETAYADLVA